MIYNPNDVIPLTIKGIRVSSREGLMALGMDDLGKYYQYWQEQKKRYLGMLEETKEVIRILNGKTPAEIKAMAEENNVAFCSCNSCKYGKPSQSMDGQKQYIDCPLIPMFVDADDGESFICIENTSAPLCGIANASSDEFIKICVRYLRSRIEIVKRSYNHANDCMVYLDGIIKHINSTPA